MASLVLLLVLGSCETCSTKGGLVLGCFFFCFVMLRFFFALRTIMNVNFDFSRVFFHELCD